ncbi:CaiB/BaiF CoA transferase family protein [Roseovarius sp.]|uniref:CaiB/BaiF CoA transferase family protein n=1 Tax=Roseovarius sp. TaxID=1486281 RepID=UPI00356400AB
MAGPLSGKTILEIGHMLAGPYCGMLLADLGARVIKIEGPDGDIGRTISPHTIGAHNAYFASLNRGKESVVLDLTSDAGQADLRRLASGADALLTNLRPSAIKKLGLTYDVLQHVNKRLVCVALTGYGLEGPFSESPAYDYVIQAMTGVMMMTGDPNGPPVKPGYSAVDNSAGIMGALALVAKIVEGRGGQMDVSMYDTLLSQLNYVASAYLNAGVRAERLKDGAHPYIVPAQLFAAREGYLVLFITHDKFWRLFAEALSRPDWLDDPRFATMKGRQENRDLVVAAIAEELQSETAVVWAERLAPLGVVAAAVQTLPDALDGQLTASRDMVVEVPVGTDTLRMIGNPIKDEDHRCEVRPPPALGEHDSILRTLPGQETGT